MTARIKQKAAEAEEMMLDWAHPITYIKLLFATAALVYAVAQLVKAL